MDRELRDDTAEEEKRPEAMVDDGDERGHVKRQEPKPDNEPETADCPGALKHEVLIDAPDARLH
jgi:hypothetical protein